MSGLPIASEGQSSPEQMSQEEQAPSRRRLRALLKDTSYSSIRKLRTSFLSYNALSPQNESDFINTADWIKEQLTGGLCDKVTELRHPKYLASFAIENREKFDGVPKPDIATHSVLCDYLSYIASHYEEHSPWIDSHYQDPLEDTVDLRRSMYSEGL